MSADGETTAKPTPALPKTNPMEQFVTFVAFLVGMVVLIDPVARDLTGRAVGTVLNPVIGFGGAYPVLTILFASVVMVAITSVVRHYFTDYLEQAKAQEIMKAFQKELKDARKENNLHKMKKLTEKNQDLMKLQAEQSSAQLKPMALTLVVVIPIFAWLLLFLDPAAGAHGAPNPECDSIGAVPWQNVFLHPGTIPWCLDINIQAKVPPFEWFPRWVALYSLFSIPIGQVVGRVLKAHDLRAEFEEKGA
jgi:uncharacterized membrane protein (DUF106 family)